MAPACSAAVAESTDVDDPNTSGVVEVNIDIDMELGTVGIKVDSMASSGDVQFLDFVTYERSAR